MFCSVAGVRARLVMLKPVALNLVMLNPVNVALARVALNAVALKLPMLAPTLISHMSSMYRLACMAVSNPGVHVALVTVVFVVVVVEFVPTVGTVEFVRLPVPEAIMGFATITTASTNVSASAIVSVITSIFIIVLLPIPITQTIN